MWGSARTSLILMDGSWHDNQNALVANRDSAYLCRFTVTSCRIFTMSHTNIFNPGVRRRLMKEHDCHCEEAVCQDGRRHAISLKDANTLPAWLMARHLSTATEVVLHHERQLSQIWLITKKKREFPIKKQSATASGHFPYISHERRCYFAHIFFIFPSLQN